LNQVIVASSSTDVLWVHYSGHGTQIRDTNGDEADGFDECIVPCNYNTDGIITDDELFAIIKNAKCQLMLFFDSCHSGTVCDLQYSMNYNNGVLAKSVSNNRSIVGTNIIMFSGCRDSQTSADAYSGMAKQGVGAFTNTLLETLRASDHNIDLLSLYSKLCVNLRATGFQQIPVLSSSVASPSFQFARSNSNGNAVASLNVTSNGLATKNGLVYDTTISSSNQSLNHRMSMFFKI